MPYQKSYKSFSESRKYIQAKKFKNKKASIVLVKSSKKLDVVSLRYKSFLEAKKYIQSKKFKNRGEFICWAKSNKKPKDIPSSVHSVYKKEWKGWGDFLGTNHFSPHQRSKGFWSYKKARAYVRKLKLGSKKEFELWAKGEICHGQVLLPKFPTGKVPFDPYAVYKKEWKGYRDFLDSKHLAPYQKKYCSFSIAYKWVRRLNEHHVFIDSKKTYKEYCEVSKKYESLKVFKKGKFKGLKVKPTNIPDHPQKIYQSQWRGWSFFLLFVQPKREPLSYRSYKKACLFVKNLHLKNQFEWRDYCRDSDLARKRNRLVIDKGKFKGSRLVTGRGKFKGSRLVIDKGKFKGLPLRPVDIPRAVYHHYKNFRNENFSWGDFLGSGNIPTRKRNYRSYVEAKKFVQSLNLKGQVEWKEYCRVSLEVWAVVGSFGSLGGSLGSFGFSGVKGASGLSGAVRGASGSFGVKGASGSSGVKGASGLRGVSGVKGASGSFGVKGVSGLRGVVRGASGVKGVSGLRGAVLGSKGAVGGLSVFKSGRFKGLPRLPVGKFKGLPVKPIDIPVAVDKTYRKDFEGFGCFLGTGNLSLIKAKYRSFFEFKRFLKKSLDKRCWSQKGWNEYAKQSVSLSKKGIKVFKTGKFKGLPVKPIDIPSAYHAVYSGKYKTESELWK